MTMWSPAASERLIELYDEGRSASVIANLLAEEGLIDVTRNAIIGRAHRLRLPRRAPRKSQRVDAKAKARAKQDRQNELRKLKRATLKVKPPMPPDEATREKLRSENIQPLHITIYELTDDTCRYPYGDRPPFTYCGHATVQGSSYCAVHSARCLSGGGWKQ